MSFASATPRLLGATAAAFIVAGSAQADLIGVELQDFPDIASRFIDVTYDSFSNTLVIEGIALAFDDDGSAPAEQVLGGSFSIVANIDESGNAVSGTLEVGGSVLGFGGGGTPLLTGDLSDFGFETGGGPVFDFHFDVSGGDLANPFYGGVGNTIGVILSGTGFQGSFENDFDNLIGGLPGTGTGVSDLGLLAIPAPGALAVLALAAVRSRRRRV